MNLVFKSLFTDNISYEYAQLWEGTLIERVEVLKDKKIWRIYLLLPKPLPAEIIINTAQTLGEHHDYLEAIELIPQINDSSCILEIINERKDDLSSYLFSNGETLIDNTGIKLNLNNHTVDLVCDSQELYTTIIDNDICTRLAIWFSQEYCLQLLVRALCQQNKNTNNKADNWVSRKDELVEIGEDSGKKGRYSKNKDKRVAGAKLMETPIPIKELEEGLKAAVAEGEVWNKEINTLRDGRLVISYYLTDYTDSIVVKTFIDNIKNDGIAVGDWIKVKGGVHFDPYHKEIVLFMEQYTHKERIDRTDKSNEKRIELHAHTKMSSMDGLTEVREMIKRAAQWGHSAIAITDHGCTQAFPEAYAEGKKHKIKVIYGVEAYLVEEDKKERSYHIILLAQNTVGLKNLYRLISLSYLDYFYRKPRIPRKKLIEFREGLLLGTACNSGELYGAILRQDEPEQIARIIDFYDYLEIQPIANNRFLLKDNRVESEDGLKEINRQIVALGNQYNKPVVATGDVHFLDPQHEIFRAIIQAGQGYKDAEAQAPLYLRTTEEMLDEFSYLGVEDARRVVIDNPTGISNLIEVTKPVPDGFYPPKIESAEQEIVELTWQKAHSLYGQQLPEIVETRIVKELAAITKHGFSVLYLIAHKLVKKSNDDGYLVGSRGSVGSSLVAFLTGITEVNALAPHYICPQCFYHEFFMDGSVGCGADLEDMDCPECGYSLRKDGFDIPFETFLGFEGNKIPDIDLNFSGDYQSRAHQYVEELFGSENVFRAGTISTIADKTAFGFVKKYAEEKELPLRNTEISRLAQGITGVRRTTGQHPGGLIVVPRDHDIMEFTPLQHPADNKESGITTTHFDYHAIGDQLVKLDILGHDDPTVIKELEDLTGVKANTISLSEPATMRLFSGVEPLQVKPEDIDSSVGTYGIPEFGTRFVRQMLEITRPTSFSELVRICGLSHGTDVWLNNANALIEDQTASLNEVICTRDDIMTRLIDQGMEKNTAFDIMESVRKGKGLKPEEVTIMEKCQVPSWYINSCQKINYLFPRAHAVAYVTNSFRIAWYKVNYPLEFYASFFSIRAEDFDAETVLGGYEVLRKRIKEIERMGQNAPQKEKKLLTILELAMEMYARGFQFYPVDIYLSQAQKFLVAKQGLILPFSALPNIGASAAQGVIVARDEGTFISIEDFQIRTRLNKSAMDILRKENCFESLPENTQISLFA